MEFKTKSYAKINLSLDIISKRADNYHNLCMIMHSVDLHDDITLKFNDTKQIIIRTNLSYLPVNHKNFAYKAAEDFFKYTGIENNGLEIEIKKNIPVSAGLAGGSSNAAAVLRALNKMFHAGLTNKQLAEIGIKTGSDVPYCIYGTTCLCEGRGDIITELDPYYSENILLVKPDAFISTAEIFGNVRMENVKLHPDTEGMIKALRNKKFDDVPIRLFNVLESITVSKIKEISEIKKQMLTFGASGAVMSGSGPTVFGIFNDSDAAKNAQKYFVDKKMWNYLSKSV